MGEILVIAGCGAVMVWLAFMVRGLARRSIWGQFQFSVATLLGFTAVAAVCLGLDQVQRATGELMATPLPVTIMFALLLWGIIYSVAADFRSERNDSTESALAGFRRREQRESLLLPDALQDSEPADEQPVDDESASDNNRRPWWLRRGPNRFRSISHRDFHGMRMWGHYSRDD
jgi:hypothetical protein